MKAIVKAIGVELEVHLVDKQARYIGNDGVTYWEEDLDFDIEDKNNPNYWTCLEHTYAGMAMQGMVSNSEMFIELGNQKGLSVENAIAEASHQIAHALVEKLKEKEEK